MEDKYSEFVKEVENSKNVKEVREVFNKFGLDWDSFNDWIDKGIRYVC